MGRKREWLISDAFMDSLSESDWANIWYLVNSAMISHGLLDAKSLGIARRLAMRARKIGAP